ncbi:hypothetical protein BJ912DRAFT_1052809 [Pholiota molesta]|nr:hypothetical protein BJ912DRAFT_1052809 [Pholiota molesta]
MDGHTIFHLPYELLAHIFDQSDVSNEALFNLALTSRRLHLFALSVFFTRFQISNPTEHAEIIFRNNPPYTRDALDGLRIALFVPSIKHLVCRFELEQDAEDYEVVIRHMRRLHELVSALKAVEDVKLVLGNERCGCCSAFGSGDVLDDALMEWSATIGRTWSKIVEKGCVSLSIVGRRYMGHAELIGDILTPLSDAAKEHAVLRSLIINSMIMVVPPLLHWTISALRLPTVETLHIMNISVNRKCWPAVFAMISNNAPHLTGVRLSGVPQLVPADLLHFLASLPKLRTLHLGHNIDCVDTFDLGPFPDFPSLFMLHAPASWERWTLTLGTTLDHVIYSYLAQRTTAFAFYIAENLSRRHPGLADDGRRGEAAKSGFEVELDEITSLTLVFDEQIDSDDIPLSVVLPKWLSLFFGLRYLAMKTQPSVNGTGTTDAAVTALVVGILKEGELAEISSVEVNGVEVNSDTCREQHGTLG